MIKKINRKAFSLIELLVVLVIMSLIFLLIIPVILKNISNSKSTLYDTQMENIKSAARIYMTNMNLDNTSITITVGELEKGGFLDKDLKDPKTGKEINKCIKVNIKDINGFYQYEIDDQNYDIECVISDSISLILIGSSKTEVPKDNKYQDEGIIVQTANGKKLDSSNIDVTITKKKDGVSIDTIVGKYKDLSDLIDTSDFFEYNIEYSYDGELGKSTISRQVLVKNLNVVYHKPEIIISPKGWSQSKKFTVDFEQEGTYLIYSGMDLQILKGSANECTNVRNAIYECSDTSVTNIEKQKWYRIEKNSEFRSIEKGVVISKVTNGINYATSSATIYNIDRTAPEQIDFNVTNNKNKLIVNITDSKDSESGIYGYFVSVDDGLTWKNEFIEPNKSTEIALSTSGEYKVKVRAVNNTYPNVYDVESNDLLLYNNDKKMNKLNSKESLSKIVYFENNPPIISNPTYNSKTNSIALNYIITDGDSIDASGVDPDSIICEYGETISYGKTVKGTINSCNFNDLKKDTIYYYKITVSDYLKNKASITGTARTAIINNPIINVTAGWAKSKDVTITYDDTNITIPSYYFYSSSNGTITSNVQECGNNGSSPAVCNDALTTTIKAGYWYKTENKENNIQYIEIGNIIAVTHDESDNKSSNISASITQIDRTPPDVTSFTINNKTLSTTATDLESGVASYTYKQDNSILGTDNANANSSSKTYNNISNGTHTFKVVVCDAVGNCTDGNTLTDTCSASSTTYGACYSPLNGKKPKYTNYSCSSSGRTYRTEVSVASSECNKATTTTTKRTTTTTTKRTTTTTTKRTTTTTTTTTKRTTTNRPDVTIRYHDGSNVTTEKVGYGQYVRLKTLSDINVPYTGTPSNTNLTDKYEFVGWSTSSSNTSNYSIYLTVTSDIDLYALYRKTYHSYNKTITSGTTTGASSNNTRVIEDWFYVNSNTHAKYDYHYGMSEGISVPSYTQYNGQTIYLKAVYYLDIKKIEYVHRP